MSPTLFSNSLNNNTAPIFQNNHQQPSAKQTSAEDAEGDSSCAMTAYCIRTRRGVGGGWGLRMRWLLEDLTYFIISQYQHEKQEQLFMYIAVSKEAVNTDIDWFLKEEILMLFKEACIPSLEKHVLHTVGRFRFTCLYTTFFIHFIQLHET